MTNQQAQNILEVLDSEYKNYLEKVKDFQGYLTIFSQKVEDLRNKISELLSIEHNRKD